MEATMKKSMMSVRIACSGMLFMLLSLAFTDSSAQLFSARLDRYVQTTFNPSFSSIISGGTYLGTAGDDAVGTTTLPFNFSYDSTTYLNGMLIYITSNGSINFAGNSINTTANRYNNGLPTYPLHVCPMTGDMYTNGIYSRVDGSAPNRVWTMEWTGFRYWTGGTPTTMQMKLYETTNVIEYLWESSVTLNGTGSIALNGRTTPSYMSRLYSTTNVTPTVGVRYTVPPNLPNRQISTTPKSMNFGSILTGQSTLGVVTVTHVGTESIINLLPPSFTGPAAADYSVVSGPTPTGPLGIGQSATYTVRFLPTFGGNRNAIFYVNSDGRDSGSQGITLTGFGIAPRIQVTPTQLFKSKRVGLGDTLEQSIVITSIGAADLYFTNYPNSFPFSGEAPGDYVVSRYPVNPLPAGSTDTLKIKFIPKEEGLRPAQLNINSNAENNPSVVVLLKGVGVIPRMVIAPTYLDFDSVQVTDTLCKQIKVYNVGSDTLSLKNQYFASNDGDFSFTPLAGLGLNIPGNDSSVINICFVPLQRGTRQARLRIIGNIPLTFEYNPRDTSAVDVEIRGNAIPLDKTIIAMKDISDAIIGEDAVTTLELTNVGTEPVLVKAPIISGTNASEFSVTKVNFPATVAPGASISMSVTTKPFARGERTANIKFNLTSEGRPFSVNADIKANALLACAASNAKAVNFEKLLLEESATKTVEVSNCGDIPQTFAASLTGSSSYMLDASSAEVPVGAKVTFTITFAPKSEGAANATLTIKGSHIADMSVTLNGTGEKKEVVTQSVGKVSEMDGFSLEQNAPNPAVGYTNFTFTAPKQSTVRLYLADMSGKVVREIANSNYSSGKHSISMDTKELASGSYVYILESGATRIMRQMIVTK